MNVIFYGMRNTFIRIKQREKQLFSHNFGNFSHKTKVTKIKNFENFFREYEFFRGCGTLLYVYNSARRNFSRITLATSRIKQKLRKFLLFKNFSREYDFSRGCGTLLYV